MNTECSHCGKHFHVSDRALGKRAKCKSCGQVFVVRPSTVEDVPMQEVAAPPAMGSTRRMRPVRETPEPEADNPLAALADAADASQHDHADEVQEYARSHGSYLTRREHGEHSGTAPGATASMVMGILGLVLFPVVIGAVFAILAVVYGNGARRRIRRSRGVLEGRGHATAGILMGWIALLLLCIGGIVGLIILFRTGPFVGKTEVITQ